MKHTKGPWRMGQTMNLRNTVLACEKKVAQVNTSNDESFYNGNLIAAAPELLKVAQWALNQLKEMQYNGIENTELAKILEKLA